ncbi:ribosome biogenesis GTPase YlqF [Liquorilactobacillus satsumensis]|uniref:Ribosome biogenesis GTPase A n=1 Tax=Liquorilactobacillus satsumensis DSM 16230 = JCM 12392 TaxID=1423801 RepID=A0A0R1V1H6_9LACO|nr:ribosome biogenesis GTPase YlqF [Liquorilactobacillus satsumensis]KRL99505.1 GTP-binding protein, GTPase [Liquorilactobacillus satsumensis DSM 16230 = JCM 12392]MCP9312058.1 ribosome biogenesis GTPase YlqF [Liquorilactobacillus satsumensis]MCP9327855.1 ribosome biogenesis GTPase YlqF [Liquorilactobacillus satsumensis]MCP9359336.1 ribosome biogenesis GTPase YlqF [Liquorilactobacillus satsumensis]
MAVIQWFPGHMAKALRQVKENVKQVDIVLELVDARLPESSRNPQLVEILQNKPSIVVLTKEDLADPQSTRRWVSYYEKTGQPALAVNSQKGDLRALEQKIYTVLQTKLTAQHQRGIVHKRIKVMCIGIPNVGKSTLLNQLLKRRAAQVGNRPGVTKAQQWLKAGSNLLLLDTPGILWPKFEDPLVGKKLALTGAIKDTLYAKDDVALYLLEHFLAQAPQELRSRYQLAEADLKLNLPDLLLKITHQIGMRDDYDRASERMILDCRRNKLGRYTLDQVPENI